MNGIAPKVTEKVGVLFQNQDFDPGARQQLSQHHSRRATARNAAGSP